MRLLLPALLAASLLSGCAKTGYLLDHTAPSKRALIAPEIARFGVGGADTRCVSERLARTLSVWQLRQLSAALRSTAAAPGALTLTQLLAASSRVPDPEVPAAVPEAIAACEVTLASTLPPLVPIPVAPAETPPEPGEPAVRNGPADYRPSEPLLNALEAFEKEDYATAARLARLAADQGDSGAQQFLGGLYAYGRGVRADPAAAVRYYGLAAEQGWSEAMNNLGKAYETGEGVKASRVEALKWYLLASARSTEDDRVVAANIASLTGTMSVADIERAADLARQWERGRKP